MTLWSGFCSVVSAADLPSFDLQDLTFIQATCGRNGYRVICSPRFEKSVKLSKTLHDVFYFYFIF